MAKWQSKKSKALQPIPRVVDNTDANAIKQWSIDDSHHPVRTSDMPSGPGSFSPYGNSNFR